MTAAEGGREGGSINQEAGDCAVGRTGIGCECRPLADYLQQVGGWAVVQVEVGVELPNVVAFGHGCKDAEEDVHDVLLLQISERVAVEALDRLQEVARRIRVGGTHLTCEAGGLSSHGPACRVHRGSRLGELTACDPPYCRASCVPISSYMRISSVLATSRVSEASTKLSAASC